MIDALARALRLDEVERAHLYHLAGSATPRPVRSRMRPGLATLLDAMPDVVTKMHADSGLTDEVRRSAVTVPEAEAMVLDYIRAHVTTSGAVPLAGNSIATDRGFIARDMPELDAYLHYRMVDVSSIKELTRRWYPRVYFNQPEKGLAHRALADIRESIAELRYYREAVFVPAPGPTSNEAQVIAKRYEVGR